MGKTKNFLIEIKQELLINIQMSVKKRGTSENVITIILMRVLRKLISSVMIRRTTDRIANKIPLSKATHLERRSTTEHVFSINILAENPLKCKDFEPNIFIRHVDSVRLHWQKETLVIPINSLKQDKLPIFKIILRKHRNKSKYRK